VLAQEIQRQAENPVRDAGPGGQPHVAGAGDSGARSADRSRADVIMCCPVFVAVGDTQQEIDAIQRVSALAVRAGWTA
jgi:hypothetical protein